MPFSLDISIDGTLVDAGSVSSAVATFANRLSQRVTHYSLTYTDTVVQLAAPPQPAVPPPPSPPAVPPPPPPPPPPVQPHPVVPPQPEAPSQPPSRLHVSQGTQTEAVNGNKVDQRNALQTLSDTSKKRAYQTAGTGLSSPSVSPPSKKHCDGSDQNISHLQIGNTLTSNSSIATLVDTHSPSTSSHVGQSRFLLYSPRELWAHRRARLAALPGKQEPASQSLSSATEAEPEKQVEAAAVALPSPVKTESEAQMEAAPVDFSSSSETEPESQIEPAPVDLSSSSQTEPETQVSMAALVGLPSSSQTESETQPEENTNTVSSQTETETQEEKGLDSPRSLREFMLSDDNDDDGTGRPRDEETQYVSDSEGEEELSIPGAVQWPVYRHRRNGTWYRHPPGWSATQGEELLEELNGLPGDISE